MIYYPGSLLMCDIRALRTFVKASFATIWLVCMIVDVAKVCLDVIRFTKGDL